METMNITMTGKAGTTGALCRDAVRPPFGVGRDRVSTDTIGGAFVSAIANSATTVAFPLRRAVD